MDIFKYSKGRTSRNHIIEISGIKKTIARWAAEYGISYATLVSRLKRGDMGEKLIRNVDIKHRNRKSLKLRS